MKSERKQKFYRILSFFLIINILGEVFFPTCAYALTGGPSQPEFDSFEPAGTNQMVDLFTGDFNYNIPLLNIPGPNGGYPVNLGYHAAPSMEQEASWVGLGWNINPGVINRNVRGLPDDFNGDQVTKEFFIKKRENVDFSVGLGEGNEFFGFPMSPVGSTFGITYDNYKGVGISFSTFQYVGINYSTQDGLGLSFSASQSLVGPFDIGLSVDLNSREGITSWGAGITAAGSQVAGFSSAAKMPVPSNVFPMQTTLYQFDVKAGTFDFGDFDYYQVTGSVSETTVANSTQSYSGFGYCYLHNNPETQTGGYLLDFNRENDYPITKEVEALPLAILTNDIYSASAEGLRGTFRANRADMGILSDPKITNTTQGNVIQAEVGIGDLFHVGTAIPNALTVDETSGRWSSNYEAIVNGVSSTNIDFINGNLGDDAFDFKFMDELNTDDNPITANSNIPQGAQAIGMNTVWKDSDHKYVPELINQLNGGPGFQPHYQYRHGRRKRDKLIEYHTRAELNGTAYAPGAHVLNSYPTTPYTDYTTYESNLQPYSYSGRKGHHIGEMSIVKSDGFRYQYGIPVYQNQQKDVVFTVNPPFGFDAETYSQEAAYNSSVVLENTAGYPNNYTSGLPTAGNSQGVDNFYASSTLPEHASNYLLTAVFSPDYVDLTGDGPTKDDMGYYVKYNYFKKQSGYKWRMPYKNAFLTKGNYTDPNDDKGSYMYGEKEIWYVNSIETKTHIAVFNVKDRADGIEASGDKNTPGLGSNKLSYLDHIDLFDIKDMSQSIQTVNFVYDYSLCSGVQNNSGASVVINGTDINAAKGKLTLKKVWFSYLGNNKGSLSPYIFDYTTNNPNTGGFSYAVEQNPSYSQNNSDRWGFYKYPVYLKGGANSSTSLLTQVSTCGNDDYIYTDQSLDYDHNGTFDSNGNGKIDENDDDVLKRNFNASAWSLRKITLPSGGTITIDYEQDDYAYIQDKEATEMFQIIGTGSTPNNDPIPTFGEDISGGNTRIFFVLKADTIQPSGPNHKYLNTNINDYLPAPEADGKRYISFKAFVQLKSTLDFKSMARDYVEGYFDIVNAGIVDGTNLGLPSTGGGSVGFIDVSSVQISNVTGGLTHPIRKAAWQHLKLKRQDLLYPQTNSLSVGISILQILMTIFTDAEQELMGYYNSCYTNGYSSKLDLTGHQKPSFIRLKDPNGHKKGGGYRVRRITYSDSWNNMAGGAESTSTYGQEYSYLLSDGKSSGVASYEPIIGGEENPFKIPSRTYSPINGDIPFKSRDLYLEKPYGEKYYPAPVVGYSRVIVKNIDRTDNSGNIINTKSLSGVSVSEFYTAKDFPTTVDYTAVNSVSYEPQDINIPYIGTIKYDNHGYSQGFEIVLNNMHGQIKSQATYAPIYFNKTVYGYKMASFASPQAMVQYFYHTSGNTLNNNVTVLDKDGNYRTALVGQTAEEFVDLKENTRKKDFTYVNMNLDFIFPFIEPYVPFLLTVLPWPSLGYEESMLRSAIHNKVVYQSGIISEVRTTKDGSTIITKNLMYDSNTGEPLLTTTTNNFNKPIYTYNYQASWAYNAMGPAYTNYRYTYKFSTSTSAVSGVLPVSTGTSFTLGDMVIVNGNSSTYYWITSLSGTSITLTNRYGQPFSGSASSVTILKSGYTNQQDLKMGHIVSLKNPLSNSGTATYYNSGFINALAATLTSYATNIANDPSYSTTDFLLTFTDCSGSPNGGAMNLVLDANGYITKIHFGRICNGAFNIIFATPVNPAFFSNITVTNTTASSVVFTNNSTTGTFANQSITGTFQLTDTDISCIICPGKIDSILQVSAMHYTDNWDFDYNDIGNPQADLAVGSVGNLTASQASSNRYRYGTAGIWRPLNNWAYITQRSQYNGGTPTSPQDYPQTQIDKDGTFSFTPHKWFSDRLYNPTQPTFNTSFSVSNNPRWTFVSEITRYNPYGYINEKVDALGIYSSVLYGYNNSLKTAETSNASYYETAFEGFEEQRINGTSATYLAPTGGHIFFSTTPTLVLTPTHTGKISLKLNAGNNISIVVSKPNADAYTLSNTYQGFTPIQGGHYLLSFWIKQNSNIYNGALPTVSTSSPVNSPNLVLGPTIDGWQKVDYDFTVPSGLTTSFNLNIGFNNTSVGGYIDDIRIQPYKSAMKSYIYDQNKLWLVGELDNRNFATFYNYDEEGQVVQVKKETEKGIVTVKTSRNNIRRNPNP